LKTLNKTVIVVLLYILTKAVSALIKKICNYKIFVIMHKKVHWLLSAY